MNENKRFIYTKSEGGVGYAIYDTTKNYTFPNLPREYEATVFCKILNKLYEKNKELQIITNFWKEQCGHRVNEHKNHYSINHCLCTADDFIHELRKGYEELQKENGELKQQLADIDKLIYDLGHNEMQRQYEEITKENGENE